MCDTRLQWIVTKVMLPDKWVFNQRPMVNCQNRWRLCFQLTRASRHCVKIWRYIYHCLICFACKYMKMLDSHPITPYPLVTSYECIHAAQKYLRVFCIKFYKVRYTTSHLNDNSDNMTNTEHICRATALRHMLLRQNNGSSWLLHTHSCSSLVLGPKYSHHQLFTSPIYSNTASYLNVSQYFTGTHIVAGTIDQWHTSE